MLFLASNLKLFGQRMVVVFKLAVFLPGKFELPLRVHQPVLRGEGGEDSKRSGVNDRSAAERAERQARTLVRLAWELR